MLIEEYLEKDLVIFPESYWSSQVNSTKKILKIFEDINVVTEKYNRLVKHESIPNAIILSPIEGDRIVGVPVLPPGRYVAELGNTKKGKLYIKIQTKEPKNNFTLVIWFS